MKQTVFSVRFYFEASQTSVFDAEIAAMS